MRRLHILIACEESQLICSEFRALGHVAYSCDLQECSGGHPEWHIHGDCVPLLNTGKKEFVTQDGVRHSQTYNWDLIIAHPPCTYLTISGNRWFNVDKYGDLAVDRINKRNEASDFFMKFVNAECEHICIENPKGVMSTKYRKPDDVIQPWMFGDNSVKGTCLWLKGLPKLIRTCDVKPHVEYKEWIGKDGYKRRQDIDSYRNRRKRKVRSRTFPGIAKAIAKQWAFYLCTL